MFTMKNEKYYQLQLQKDKLMYYGETYHQPEVATVHAVSTCHADNHSMKRTKERTRNEEMKITHRGLRKGYPSSIAIKRPKTTLPKTSALQAHAMNYTR